MPNLRVITVVGAAFCHLLFTRHIDTLFTFFEKHLVVSHLFAYFAIVLQTSDVSDGQFEVLQRLNPVSPMDDRDRGCRESVTLGRAGLTLHRWFDVIAVCAS